MAEINSQDNRQISYYKRVDEESEKSCVTDSTGF